MYEDTESVEDALLGMEDLRPPLLPQPPGFESGPLGSASQPESDPRERSLFGNLCFIPWILLLLRGARMTGCPSTGSIPGI